MSEQTEPEVQKEPTEVEIKQFIQVQTKYLRDQLPLLRLRAEFSKLNTQLDTDEVERLKARITMAQYKAEQEKAQAAQDGDSK